MPFVGASPSSPVQSAWIHTHTLSHAHTHTQFCPRSLIHNHVLSPPCDSSNTHGHVYTRRPTHRPPHHPWVMNNICLSIPPSLPLAWLLASSWLRCHNVISSAFPSPITKCVVTIGLFLHGPSPSTAPGDREHQLAHTRRIQWCVVIFKCVWKRPVGSGRALTWRALYFWTCYWLPCIGLGPIRLWNICPSCPHTWLWPW